MKRLIYALLLALACVGFAFLIPNAAAATGPIVVTLAGSLALVYLAVRPTPRAQLQAMALFSVGGATHRTAGVAFRTSWRDIKGVTAKGGLITVRSGSHRQRYATGVGPAETAEVVAAIEHLRAAAAAHPDASPPTVAIAAFQVCGRCGALRAADATAGQCVVCGEPDPDELRRRVFGRSSPRALQRTLLWLAAWTCLYVVLGVTMICISGIALKVASIIPFWIAFAYLRATHRIAATRRNFLDRVWIVRDDRIDLVSGRLAEALGWAQAGDLSVGPTINGWTRLRLERRGDEQKPAEIWVDVQRDSVEEIGAAVGAARAAGGKHGFASGRSAPDNL